MPDNKILHWTEDDDLLSRFVLGGITSEEKRKLEEHLVSCDQCRDAVENEQTLAMGIRQFGREDVKKRLKNRLSAKPISYRRLVTRQRVVSAAAVVVIITGVGIFSHWFSWGEHSGPDSTKEIEKTVKPHDGEVDSRASQNTTVLSEPPNVPKESGRDGKAEEKSQSLQSQVAQNPPTAKSVQQDLNEPIKGIQNLSGAASSGAGAVSLKKDLENQNSHFASEDTNVHTFWVEGKVLRGRQVGANNFKALNKAAAPDRNMQESNQSLKMIDRQQPMHNILDRQEITIHQQSIDFLPSTREEMQREDGDEIQMQIEQSDRGTEMTMYLHTLFDETELKNASIEQIGSDSIVIETKSRAIGFKMPNDLLELQKLNQNSKRK